MQILTSIADMRAATRPFRLNHETLALVPTMGAIHEGHLSLVRAALLTCDRVASSIFVNPLQFAPTEDLARYPRTFEADITLLEDAGVDLLFAPSTEEMYPAPQSIFVDVEGIGSRLDGASRPGHFRGVATVVLKLFNIVAPDVAFFGQKDAAQVAVLRALKHDLNLPIRLVVCPTLRDPDGLALSSRNRYLSLAQRMEALALSRSLHTAEALMASGVTHAATLRTAILEALAVEPSIRIDYVEIVDPDTLLPLEILTGPTLIAAAAYCGETRLIDNILVTPRA